MDSIDAIKHNLYDLPLMMEDTKDSDELRRWTHVTDPSSEGFIVV